MSLHPAPVRLADVLSSVSRAHSYTLESSLVPFLISRLSSTPELHSRSVSKSFLISSDVGQCPAFCARWAFLHPPAGHALHPNYTSKHQDNHRPMMNRGVVIKTNAKQRYATDAISSFLVRQLVARKGGNLQEFEVRNDMACGSTIGPHLSVQSCHFSCEQLLNVCR